jgi:LysR family hydrogen peroxide-inducible transcriptional activator
MRQLRYLDALARFRHFGLAAKHCAVTQPALSTQIQELERKLGVELVERGPKAVRLTPAGREAAERAARILAQVRDLGDYARHHARLLTGHLRLGVIPTVAPYLLPQLLPMIRARFPELELHIRETLTGTLAAELADGTLDLLLIALPLDQGEVETMQLFSDRFMLAMPARRRIKSSVRATPELLKHDRLLLLEEGHCLRDQALSFCELRQADNIDTFGATSLSTIVQMVANGLGLTLLPELSLEVETKRGGIRLMRFVEPEPSRVIGLAWRATSPRKRDFAALGRLIATAVPAKRRLLSRETESL